MKTVTVAAAIANVTKSLDQAIEKAAGNDRLSKAEQKAANLPYFAHRELADLREKNPGKTLFVPAAQKALQ